MRIKSAVPLLLLALCFLCLQPNCFAQNSNITITSFPAWGQSGLIKGKVTGISPQNASLHLLLFLPDVGWSDPTNCSYIPFGGNGEFQVDLSSVAPYNNPLMFRYWTRINVYAISGYTDCIQAREAIPFFLDRNAVAKTSVPRLPQFRTISFAGLDWYVKDAPNKVFPGPNYFVGDNAFVDSAGKLHLRITKCGDSWCAAELYTKERVGYGTYTFTIDSALDALDPKATLGLFTWDEYNSDNAHMEWDIEFAKWGNASSSTNAQYVVQPYTVPGNLQRFTMTSGAPSVHQVDWTANSVTFRASAAATQIAQTTIASATTPIPQPGDARLHLNYYIADGTAPTIPVDREIVISAFQYTPSVVQTGFTQTTDAVPYLATSKLASITSSNGNCPAFLESDSPWLQVSGQITGSGTILYTASENTGTARVGNLILHSVACNLALGKQVLTVSQASAPCPFPTFETPLFIGGDGGDLSVPITTGPGCPWNAVSSLNWLVVTSKPDSRGSGVLTLRVAPNTSAAPRIASVTVGTSTIQVNEGATSCTNTLDRYGLTVPAAGGTFTGPYVNTSGCGWSASSPVGWAVAPNGLFYGSVTIGIPVAANPAPTARYALLTIAGQPFVITQLGSASPSPATRFIPIPPCRVVDTRNLVGALGGPFLLKNATRNFPIPATCGIPGDARAYSLNATVVPLESLGYLTLWPSDMPQPFVSTLNSLDGSIVANAAIVPAGGGGAVNVYASNATDLILDINGYFVDANRADAYSFYPLTPCRAADTRNPNGPLGGPSLSTIASRTFPLLSAPCAIPASSRAYSLNYTVVPRGPLGYLSTWPSGQNQPFVSTLNSPQGRVLANAAIVPAGASGAVSAFAFADPSTPTDLVIDVNGHFAPPSPGGLSFYPMTPCRVVDTRIGQGTTGEFGPPSIPKGGTRTFTLPQSPCMIPPFAAAYSLNVTVVPQGPLSYLTMWPTGVPQPFVSTLNAPDGRILANAAIVPAGTNGAISVYVLTESAPTDVIIDVNGYFAP